MCVCVSVCLRWGQLILLLRYNPKGEVVLVFCLYCQDLSSGSILIYFSTCVWKAKSNNYNLYTIKNLLFPHANIENLAWTLMKCSGL